MCVHMFMCLHNLYVYDVERPEVKSSNVSVIPIQLHPCVGPYPDPGTGNSQIKLAWMANEIQESSCLPPWH